RKTQALRTGSHVAPTTQQWRAAPVPHRWAVSHSAQTPATHEPVWQPPPVLHGVGVTTWAGVHRFVSTLQTSPETLGTPHSVPSGGVQGRLTRLWVIVIGNPAPAV